jgi:hypothetical protein
MTIDSWRSNRDSNGWRLSSQARRNQDEDELNMEESEKDTPEAPSEVRGVPRLGDDMRALQTLMASDRPVLRRVRCRKTSKAYYRFGDASGLAFGATI